MSASSCPSPEMLLAAHEEVLPDELAREVRGHLAGCEVCKQLLEDLRSPALSEPTLEELTRMRRKVLGAERRTPWYAAIAAAVVVATLAGLWMTQSQEASDPAPLAAVASPLEPAPAPEPSFRLPLEPAPLRLPLAAAVVFRGRAEENPGVDLAALGEALAPYRAGDYPRAVEALARLAQRFPNAVEPRFYLGVSKLLAGDAQAALPDLGAAQVIGGEALDDEIAWYLAVARERAGDWDAAGELLAALCGEEGPRQAAACEVLGR